MNKCILAHLGKVSQFLKLQLSPKCCRIAWMPGSPQPVDILLGEIGPMIQLAHLSPQLDVMRDQHAPSPLSWGSHTQGQPWVEKCLGHITLHGQ